MKIEKENKVFEVKYVSIGQQVLSYVFAKDMSKAVEVASRSGKQIISIIEVELVKNA